MSSYGGGYGQSRHGLMVEEEEDEDLYEGFNFSIDLAPPQTAATTNYVASSYGAPASRGGYNPLGTAFRYFTAPVSILVKISCSSQTFCGGFKSTSDPNGSADSRISVGHISTTSG